MTIVEDYVARVDGTCGKEQDVIVTFKYDKKDETIKKILRKAQIERSISRIIFELTFRNISFRLYASGKAIFRSVKDKDELNSVLTELLS
jgi:ArsR family metal-binding transcriptional regulator